MSEINVSLTITRNGIDVTGDIVGGRIPDAPPGFYEATWVASDGFLPDVTKRVSLFVDDPVPDSPTIISTIADREYTVGGSAVTIDLATKFSGATSYTVSPQPAGMSLSGAILTINPTTALALTAITVRGVNAGGQSDPLVFSLTVRIPAPTMTAPLPDLSLIQGAASVVTDLREHFADASTYAVSPTGQGVTISGHTMTASAAALRDGNYTVTATNGSGSASDTFALLVSAQPALNATLSPNPPVAGEVLTITFSAVPDSASATLDGTPVTLSGSGTTRTVTPATEGTLVITFAKAGYTASPLTVEVQPAESEPDLSREDVEGTPVISGNGDVTWTLTAPTEYAGTHTTDQSAEYSGPLNIGYTETTAPQFVVRAAITRHAGPGTENNHYPGTEYRRVIGLLQIPAGATVDQTGEWHEDGEPTGYTGMSYVRVGTGAVAYVERAEVEGLAVRTASSNAIEGEALPDTVSRFLGVADGTTLALYDDPVRDWSANTIRFAIYAPYLRRIGGQNAYYPAIASDSLGPDQAAWARIRFPSVLSAAADFTSVYQGPAVRIAGPADAEAHCYCAYVQLVSSNLKYVLRKSLGAANLTGGVDLWSSANLVLADIQGTEAKLEVQAVGDQVTLLLNDVAQHDPITDGSPLIGNFAGIIGRAAQSGGQLTAGQGLFEFDCRSL